MIFAGKNWFETGQGCQTGQWCGRRVRSAMGFNRSHGLWCPEKWQLVDFPASRVNYEERCMRQGKFPGWMKGKGTSINGCYLTARLIDRPIRPYVLQKVSVTKCRSHQHSSYDDKCLCANGAMFSSSWPLATFRHSFLMVQLLVSQWVMWMVSWLSNPDQAQKKHPS